MQLQRWLENLDCIDTPECTIPTSTASIALMLDAGHSNAILTLILTSFRLEFFGYYLLFAFTAVAKLPQTVRLLGKAW